MKNLVIEQMNSDELKETIKLAFAETFAQHSEQEFNKKIFSFKQAAKLFGKSYNFVRGLVQKGYLQATADNKYVTGKEINNYLSNN